MTMIAPTPSVPPSMRSSITWPVVAYAFVRELPYTVMVVAGACVSAIFIFKAPSSTFEPLAAVIGPALISALGRSRPPEDTILRAGPGLSMIVAWLLRR